MQSRSHADSIVFFLHKAVKSFRLFPKCVKPMQINFHPSALNEKKKCLILPKSFNLLNWYNPSGKMTVLDWFWSLEKKKKNDILLHFNTGSIDPFFLVAYKLYHLSMLVLLSLLLGTFFSSMYFNCRKYLLVYV